MQKLTRAPEVDPLVLALVRRAAASPSAPRVRELAGLTRYATSRACGRSTTSCSNWELRRWRPSPEAADKYVRLLVGLARDLRDDGNYDPAVVEFLTIGERLDRLDGRNGAAA